MYCEINVTNHFLFDAPGSAEPSATIVPHDAADGTKPDGMRKPRFTGTWEYDACQACGGDGVNVDGSTCEVCGGTGLLETGKWVDGSWVDDEAAALAAELSESTLTGMTDAIKSKRSEVQAGGVFVVNKWFHTDQQSRIQHLGLIQLGASLPTGIMWKTMDGTFIEMTAQIAADIFSAVTALDLAAFANAEVHIAAMLASPDPANYDYSTGWPVVYTP